MIAITSRNYGWVESREERGCLNKLLKYHLKEKKKKKNKVAIVVKI